MKMFHLFPVMILSIWKLLIFHNLSITDHNSFCLAWFWRHLLHLQVSYLLVSIFCYYINCILADFRFKKNDIFLFEYFKVYKGEAPMLREELGYFTHMFHNWPLIIVGDYNCMVNIGYMQNFLLSNYPSTFYTFLWFFQF